MVEKIKDATMIIEGRSHSIQSISSIDWACDKEEVVTLDCEYSRPVVMEFVDCQSKNLNAAIDYLRELQMNSRFSDDHMFIMASQEFEFELFDPIVFRSRQNYTNIGYSNVITWWIYPHGQISDDETEQMARDEFVVKSNG